MMLFLNVPTEFTNDLFVSIGDLSEETNTLRKEKVTK